MFGYHNGRPHSMTSVSRKRNVVGFTRSGTKTAFGTTMGSHNSCDRQRFPWQLDAGALSTAKFFTSPSRGVMVLHAKALSYKTTQSAK